MQARGWWRQCCCPVGPTGRWIISFRRACATRIQVGCRVTVPLGRGDRTRDGYCVL